MRRNYDLLAEIIEVLGEDAAFTLVENFAGTRLFVPSTNRPFLQLVGVLGEKHAAALSGRFGPDTIRVPLARDFRVKRLREAGMSNARIAVHLGMTEAGVSRLVQRGGLPLRVPGGRRKSQLDARAA